MPKPAHKHPWRVIDVHIKDFRRVELADFTIKGPVTNLAGKNSAGKTWTLEGIIEAIRSGRMPGVDVVRHGADEAVLTAHLSDGDAHIYTKKSQDRDGEWSLEVRDTPDGRKRKDGPAVLKRIVGKFVDLSALANADGPGRIDMLLGALGKKDELDALNADEKDLREKRERLGTQRRDKAGELEGMAVPDDGVPSEPVDTAALLEERQRLQGILTSNQSVVDQQEKRIANLAAMREREGAQRAELERLAPILKEATEAIPGLSGAIDSMQGDERVYSDRADTLRAEIAKLSAELTDISGKHNALANTLYESSQHLASLETTRTSTEGDIMRVTADLGNIETAIKRQSKEIAMHKGDIETLPEIDFTEIDRQISTASEVNKAVADKKRYETVAEARAKIDAEWDKLTSRIQGVASQKAAILSDLDVPYPDLGVSEEHRDLTVKGSLWCNLGKAEEAAVSVALAAKISPDFRFGIVRDAAWFDDETSAEVDRIAEENDFWIIKEVPGERDDSAIVMVDGRSVVKGATK